MDHWQTPIETRVRKKGDCEDISFDLYDRFEKSGIKSRPVIGKYKDEKQEGIHMWVESEVNGEMMIFDGSTGQILKKNEAKCYSELESEINKQNIRNFIQYYKNQERKIQGIFGF